MLYLTRHIHKHLQINVHAEEQRQANVQFPLKAVIIWCERWGSGFKMEQHLIPTFIKSEEKKKWVRLLTHASHNIGLFTVSSQPESQWQKVTHGWHSLQYFFDILWCLTLLRKPSTWKWNQKFKLLFIFEYPQVKITVSGTISCSSLLRLSHIYKTEISTVFSEWQELFCYLLFFFVTHLLWSIILFQS